MKSILDYGCCDVRSSVSTMTMSYIKRVLVPQAVSLILPTSSRLQSQHPRDRQVRQVSETSSGDGESYRNL